MDMYMRRKCQDCRLRKCRAVGMLAECKRPAKFIFILFYLFFFFLKNNMDPTDSECVFHPQAF